MFYYDITFLNGERVDSLGQITYLPEYVEILEYYVSTMPIPKGHYRVLNNGLVVVKWTVG